MNVIFPLIMAVSAITLCFIDPNGFLSAMTFGAKRGVELALTLAAVYCVWLGVFGIAERTGIVKKLSRIMLLPVKLIFGNVDQESCEYISANISANLLGLGGIATPMGIDAVAALKKQNNFYAITMLIVVASTSLQILPSSVLSLRIAENSANPSSVILPSVLSTLVSSASGVILTKVFVKR